LGFKLFIQSGHSIYQTNLPRIIANVEIAETETLGLKSAALIAPLCSKNWPSNISCRRSEKIFPQTGFSKPKRDGYRAIAVIDTAAPVAAGCAIIQLSS
jgi:hypothetical protein